MLLLKIHTFFIKCKTVPAEPGLFRPGAVLFSQSAAVVYLPEFMLKSRKSEETKSGVQIYDVRICGIQIRFV